MHNSAPPQGTPEWYRWMEQNLARMQTDIERLWARQPQSPDNVGDPAQNPNWQPESST